MSTLALFAALTLKKGRNELRALLRTHFKPTYLVLNHEGTLV